MSALPPKADMCAATRDVRYGPIADICVPASNSSRSTDGTAAVDRRFAAEKKQLSKLVEQSVRVLEILRVKAFCKTATSGTKDIEGFGALALLHLQPSQISGCAIFKRSCLLAACSPQCLLEKRLGLGVRCATHEQSACF